MTDGLRHLEAVGRLDPDTAYFAVDGDQTITYWSPGAEALLGFKAEDVVGVHCSKAIKCVHCAKGCGLKRFAVIRDKHMAHYHKDGAQVDFIKQAQSLHDEGGNFIGGVEILRPVKRRSPIAPVDKELSEFYGIYTADPAFLALLTSLRHIAHTEVNILIRGDSGTGKEMVAKAIHEMSRRAKKPFVAVNCGTLSREFLVSELFGHKKGSFTGAVSNNIGMVAAAAGGTLFLDEVAEMPMDAQVMLLRLLQERRYRPLGDTIDHEADVRIVSATHKPLRQAVAENRFREDLMFRLRVVPVFLPALKERTGDVPLLWRKLVAEAAEKHKLAPVETTPELLDCLDAYAWPGNVRELINIAEYITVTRFGRKAGPEHLPPEFRDEGRDWRVKPEPADKPIQRTSGPRSKLSRAEIEAALSRANGSTEEAARILGIGRATLWRKRKKLGMI